MDKVLSINSFLIASKFVPPEELHKVAEAVLRAQDISEDSWNGISRYEKTAEKSAYQAVEEIGLSDFWKDIISRWISFQWNDSQLWAKRVLDR